MIDKAIKDERMESALIVTTPGDNPSVELPVLDGAPLTKKSAEHLINYKHIIIYNKDAAKCV